MSYTRPANIEVFYAVRKIMDFAKSKATLKEVMQEGGITDQFETFKHNLTLMEDVIRRSGHLLEDLETNGGSDLDQSWKDYPLCKLLHQAFQQGRFGINF